jgi:CRP-like cAMP-binding protein
LGDFQSSRFRSQEAQKVLRDEGHRVRIFELQGDLYFGALERLIHSYLQNFHDIDRALIDLTRIGSIDEATRAIVFRFAKQAFEKGKRIVLIDPGNIFTEAERRSLVPMAFVYDQCDEALEDAEENLLAQFQSRATAATRASLGEMDLLMEMPGEALEALKRHCQPCSMATGTQIIKRGTPPDEMYFIVQGLVGVLLPTDQEDGWKQVSSFGPGMSFGELGLIQGEIRTADVVAITDVEVYSLSIKAIEAFRKEFPEGYQVILKNALVAMSQRLLRANREVAALR